LCVCKIVLIGLSTVKSEVLIAKLALARCLGDQLISPL